MKTPLLSVHDDADGSLHEESHSALEISEAELRIAVVPFDISYPPGNALRYGADPTGLADSTSALQQWLDASWAMYQFTDGQGLWNGSGGAAPVLILPPGKYKITDSLYIPTGVTIRSQSYPARTTNHTRIIMDSTGLTPGRKWTASAAIVSGGRGIPSTPNGYYYVTSAGGVTAGVEPTTWPTVIGNTVLDGTVTWICAAVTTAGDNRNKPIFKFQRGTVRNGGGLANSGMTTTIEGLEFWFVVYSATFSNPLNGSGIAIGDYPLGAILGFDVDTADFMVLNCVFQHSPAAVWGKDVNLTTATRGDGFIGFRGIGIFFEKCEFDAGACHLYMQNCFMNAFFRNCLFFAVPSSLGGTTGTLAFNNCWFELGAWFEATGLYGGGANDFTLFELKNCTIEPPANNFFISLNHAQCVDISQNTLYTAATNGGIFVRGVTGGSVSENIFINIGTGAGAGTGLGDFIAAIKALDCQWMKICNNTISDNGGGTYGGFGILTGSYTATSQYNYINGNTVTAPYFGATFNGQDRCINIEVGDVRGTNYNKHDGNIGQSLGPTRATAWTTEKRTSLTYSASISINALLGNDFSIFATNGVAFTLNAPSDIQDGQRITIWIANASGGALGVITWNAAYKMAGAFVNPANGNNRSIEFKNWGGTLYEVCRTAADVPN